MQSLLKHPVRLKRCTHRLESHKTTKFTLKSVKLPFSPISYPYSPSSLPYSHLQTPLESHLVSMLRSPLKSNDESQGNHERPKLITSNAKPLKLIAGKQKMLQQGRNSPGDQRDMPIWPSYLEGVEVWRQYYSEDFPKHYKANAAVSLNLSESF